jgi:hypothetical protein
MTNKRHKALDMVQVPAQTVKAGGRTTGSDASSPWKLLEVQTNSIEFQKKNMIY